MLWASLRLIPKVDGGMSMSCERHRYSSSFLVSESFAMLPLSKVKEFVRTQCKITKEKKKADK